MHRIQSYIVKNILRIIQKLIYNWLYIKKKVSFNGIPNSLWIAMKRVIDRLILIYYT